MKRCYVSTCQLQALITHTRDRLLVAEIVAEINIQSHEYAIGDCRPTKISRIDDDKDMIIEKANQKPYILSF